MDDTVRIVLPPGRTRALGYAVHSVERCPFLDGRIESGIIERARVVDVQRSSLTRDYRLACRSCGERPTKETK
jgi:hypothetical protein